VSVGGGLYQIKNKKWGYYLTQKFNNKDNFFCYGGSDGGDDTHWSLDYIGSGFFHLRNKFWNDIFTQDVQNKDHFYGQASTYGGDESLWFLNEY